MRSNQKMTLLFWHRKSRADTKGFAPVICRISIDAKEEEMSIGMKVHVNNWDVENKRAIEGPDAKKVNKKYLP